MAEPLPPDATQDQIDEHWLRQVYQPDERQLTLRAALAGMGLGGVMSVANIYIGMKVGWSVGMAITSTILAFSLFAVLRRLGLVKLEFTMLENNTVASAASAAGYFSSAGMVSAIPALYMTQNRMLTWYELAFWICGISLVGVLVAVPMRRQMIDIDRLPFPSGIACAETIRSMHAHAVEAIAKARSLMYGAALGVLFEIPYSVGKLGSLTNPLTWGEYIKFPATIAGQPLAAFGLKLNSSLLMYGLGALLGIRVGLSLAAGALFTYGVLGPWLAGHGIVVPGEATIFRSITNWSVWPGVLMVVVASLFSFALRWRTVVSAFGTLGRMFKSDAGKSKMSDVEVPSSWFGWGLLAATVFVCACAKLLFGIPIWMALLAVAVSFLLSVVACRSQGETDIAPLGPLGKIAQFVFAGVAPGNYQINLLCASATAGAASHSSDLLTDLKTGYILGGAPKRQFLAQVLGILAGAFFCVPTYLLVVKPEKIASPELPAPAAQQWAAVADLLANGVRYVDRGPGAGVPATVETIRLLKRLPGMAVGDTLRVAGGPNAGDYRITMMDRSTLVVDRPMASKAAEGDPADAEIVGPDGTSRGRTQVAPGAGTRPGLRFTQMPAGARTGDYVMATVGGVDIYHKMGGLDGEVAMLDHAFVEGQQPTPIFVKKMGLPPYALEVTGLTVLFGLIITLLEVYGPKRWHPYLPSIAGLGIAWVVGCWDSLAMAIGATIAWIVGRVAPKIGDRYTISTSSGIVAGASLIALVITLFRDILGWIQPPG